MKFWKMNGAGNDFLIINNLSGIIRPEQWPQIAQTVCERHRSVGADGLMAVEKSDSADYKMLFFNSDGSRASAEFDESGKQSESDFPGGKIQSDSGTYRSHR